MEYLAKVIKNVDENFVETYGEETIVCKTEQDVENLFSELSGTSEVVNEFYTKNGDVISGLQIIFLI